MRERLAQALGDPTLEVAYRLDDGRYVDATGRPVELPDRRGPCRHAGDRRRRGGRRARSRSGVARRAGARRVGPRDRRARARERASGGRGACSARGGAGVARPDRRRDRRRAAADRAQPPRRRAAAARHAVARARPRSIPRRRGRSGALVARTGRGRGGDRRAARARPRNPPDAAQGRGSRGGRRGARTTNAVAGDGATARCGSVCRIRSSSPPTSSSRKRSRTSSKHASATEASVLLEREPATLQRRGGRRRTSAAPASRAGSGLAGLRDRLEALDATLDGRQRARARARPSAPRSHAGRDRRRRAAHPRGARAPAHDEHGVEVVDQVGDADALLASVRDLAPGRRAASTSACRRRTPTKGCARPARSARATPRRPSLVLSQHLEPEYALRLVEEQARTGRLPDEGTRRPRRATARRGASGSQRVSASSTGRSSTSCSRDADGSIPLAELTPREREILALMAEGRSNQGICQTLWLSPKTVETPHPRRLREARDQRGARGQSPRARRADVPEAVVGSSSASSAGKRRARGGQPGRGLWRKTRVLAVKRLGHANDQV